ncbi:MAG: tRNA uridine-5-carboxymethylaminomethyl(34) synthesis enzyme MnmG, partial [Rhodospirillales bacterium]|nr:tRNA uridine-5-carboxymethylaminomethyl(34) synthesis enzyme MnmG [Rhodospirillales bacterium]
RLTAQGMGWGCVGSARAARFARDEAAFGDAIARARQDGATPAALRRAGVAVRGDGPWRSALEWLAQAADAPATLDEAFPWLRGLPARTRALLEAEALYAGYLGRQDADIRHFRREEAAVLAADIDYGRIGGLSNELVEKLDRVRPASLGAAARIQGMTPSALAALVGHIRRSQPFERGPSSGEAAAGRCFT